MPCVYLPGPAPAVTVANSKTKRTVILGLIFCCRKNRFLYYLFCAFFTNFLLDMKSALNKGF